MKRLQMPVSRQAGSRHRRAGFVSRDILTPSSPAGYRNVLEMYSRKTLGTIRPHESGNFAINVAECNRNSVANG